MESIKDRLCVGEQGGQWVLSCRNDHETHVVARYFNPDDAWGVAALIVEYHETHGYDADRAIWAALGEWSDAVGHAGMAPDMETHDAAYQDHYAAMAAL